MQQKYRFPYAFSGLVDTRNAADFSNEHYPNVDMLYGIFSSKEDAWDTLSTPNTEGVDALVVGRTVGVRVNGRIVEYWFEKACQSITDLVEKRVSVTEIPIEPEGEDWTSVEKNAQYVAVSQSPKGTLFKGVDNEGNEYSLNMQETPTSYVLTWLDGLTVQCMTIYKSNRSIECSYTTYKGGE